ncbi:antitoxin of toxin-antitoxin stability system [Shewanella xiamenensis]|uniref:antitoxin of toxin-antitoxin stability system n=1 Tax=Shewanella xiamenensis TaxID=332186 RepID=UPI00217CED28|nr:antitoxin of toxin-antitoxin stability system [Shewanella xiamenensis]UWG63455.1 antitoxin of toxin-antitoxin stability system [Shewanella xiamenensis]
MMLQKILCGYTTPISKFKSNPSAALAEAQGDAIAVSSNNQIQFYAVPASLFEEMTAFCEFAQRGTTTLESIPAQFTAANLNMDEVSTQMANKLKQGARGEFEEWK